MMTNINSKVKVKYLKYHLTIHFTSRLFHRKFAGNDVLSLIFCKRIAFMSTKQLWAAGNSKARQPSRKRKLFISCILFHCSSLGIVFELSFHLFEKPWVMAHDSRVPESGTSWLHWKLKKSDLFLDIGYISSFTFNETRMISPFIEVRPGIFILMGMFDILGTFRIFLCAAMLWKFSEKLYTQAGI